MMKPNYRSRRRKNLEDFIQANFFVFVLFFLKKKITIFFVCLFRLESDLAAEVWWGTADKFIIF